MPLLSICIPTYNRVDALEQCVNSIIHNHHYREDLIEIVISDNASTDGTETFVKELLKQYSNILYNRNEKNIGGDLNFIKVLQLGNGIFKKLHNDYCTYTDEGLQFLLNTIEKYKEFRTLLFFSIRERSPFSYIECNDMNQFLMTASTDVSWIGSFGFWKEDFDNLESKDQMLSSKFMQTDWILRLIKKKQKCVVCCGCLTQQIKFKSWHGDYHFVSLFVNNFTHLFDPYLKAGLITISTYEYVMKRIFVMLMRWSFALKLNKQNYTYENKGNFRLIHKCFCKYNWFWPYVIAYSIRFTTKYILQITNLYPLVIKFIKTI